MNPNTSGRMQRRPFWRDPVFVAVVVALITAGGAIGAAIITAGDDPVSSVSAPSRHVQPSGTISSPDSGDPVSRAFIVDGTLAAIPRGRHVWIVVQIGNLLFPKEPEVPPEDAHFAQEVVEGGGLRGDKFSIALLMVDSRGQREIEEWIRRGRRGRGLPGFTAIAGSEKLAVVRDLVLKPQK